LYFCTSKASKLSTSSRVDEAHLQLCGAAIDGGYNFCTRTAQLVLVY
jgi:hypothetical protein